MRLLIEIPEDTYIATCKGSMLPPDVDNVVKAIKRAQPFFKNTTNGDMIKAMFPSASETDHFILNSPIGNILYIRLEEYQEMRVQQDWWNAPYKKVRTNMEKDCSTCDYCQWSKLNHGYVCENEDSPNYGDIDDWLDGCCDRWANDKEDK